jgi:hypothetical protein
MSLADRNIVTMPTSPNFTRSEFTLVRTIGTTISPFTGQQKVQEFANVYWTANVILPPQRRNTAVNWQSFLAEAKGPANSFLFTDPDAKSPLGTHNAATLTAAVRINDTSETLSFNGTNNRVTAASNVFTNSFVGDYVHITGATNENNNGTHKITTKNSNAIVTVNTNLTTENSTASCKLRQNISGAEALSFTTSGSGTIKAGDYLGLLSGNSTSHMPFQLVMATEDATFSGSNGAVKVQPRLRKDLTAGHLITFQNARGLFRLVGKEVGWNANQVSTYGMQFQVIEDISASNT